jgi:hypothetical protein
MQLINSETEEELEMLNQTKVPAIQQGVLIIRELSDDERTREMARRREDALLEERSALGNARREGEWLQIIKVANKMFQRGSTDDDVMDFLELDKKQLEQLHKELNELNS